MVFNREPEIDPPPPEEDLVQQHVRGWEDWPDDVRDRLLEWNKDYLLSFRQGPDFLCGGGCARRIASHERGNPVVRATKKAHGTVVCEDCLIAFARKFDRPPWLGQQAAFQKLRAKFARMEQILEGTKNHNRKLKRQIEIGEAYIDRLEAEIYPPRLQEIKDGLRGKLRKPE